MRNLTCTYPDGFARLFGELFHPDSTSDVDSDVDSLGPLDAAYRDTRPVSSHLDGENMLADPDCRSRRGEKRGDRI